MLACPLPGEAADSGSCAEGRRAVRGTIMVFHMTLLFAAFPLVLGSAGIARLTGRFKVNGDRRQRRNLIGRVRDEHL